MNLEEIESKYYEYLSFYGEATFITIHFPKLMKIARGAKILLEKRFEEYGYREDEVEFRKALLACSPEMQLVAEGLQELEKE